MKSGWRILTCLLVSITIWLVYNLSQTTVGLVERTVIATGNIAGRSDRSSNTAVIIARIKSSGFRLLRSSLSKKPVEVQFDTEDFEFSGGDMYVVSNSLLNKYFPKIFTERMDVEVILSRDPVFRFEARTCVMLPVKAVTSFSFRQQYMADGDVKITPDSVLVYGDPARLSGIDAVYTKPVSHVDIYKDLSGTVKLQNIDGVRLSPDIVSYSVSVARFFEISGSVKPAVRNLPPGTFLQLFPTSVKVRFRCAFPYSGNPFDTAEFFVDYRDFVNSSGGHCLVKSDNIPSRVLDCRIEPEVCECVEYQR